MLFRSRAAPPISKLRSVGPLDMPHLAARSLPQARSRPDTHITSVVEMLACSSCSCAILAGALCGYDKRSSWATHQSHSFVAPATPFRTFKALFQRRTMAPPSRAASYMRTHNASGSV